MPNNIHLEGESDYDALQRVCKQNTALCERLAEARLVMQKMAEALEEPREYWRRIGIATNAHEKYKAKWKVKDEL
jgi:hypothetical protein